MFGVPSKGCKRFGICSIIPIVPANKMEVVASKKPWGLLTIFNSNHLEINILKKSLKHHAYRDFLSNGFFLMEEGILFYHPLQPDTFFEIPSGNYEVFDLGGVVSILFDNRPKFI